MWGDGWALRGQTTARHQMLRKERPGNTKWLDHSGDDRTARPGSSAGRAVGEGARNPISPTPTTARGYGLARVCVERSWRTPSRYAMGPLSARERRGTVATVRRPSGGRPSFAEANEQRAGRLLGTASRRLSHAGTLGCRQHVNPAPCAGQDYGAADHDIEELMGFILGNQQRPRPERRGAQALSAGDVAGSAGLVWPVDAEAEMTVLA